MTPNAIDEILIDARWLEPPEPLERVTQALSLLRPDQTIRMLLHREPFPLYPILDAGGFSHSTVPQADGSYVILIRHAIQKP